MRRKLVKTARVGTYNGPSCKRYMMSIGFREEDLFHFPYSADPDKISLEPRRIQEGPLRMFFANSLTPRKYILPFCEELIEWCQRNPGHDIEFSIAGNGSEKQPIEQLKCPDNLLLKLVGYLDPDQIKEYHAASDIYAYPTLADEWGLGIEESLGSGMPVISSVFAQATEKLIDVGKNGWTFSPAVPGSLQQAFDQALKTPREELRAMESRCREATKDYSPANSANGLCQAVLYADQLIKSGSISRKNNE